MSGHNQRLTRSEDVKVLHCMGYAQELSRRMGGFSNFAISFSIICILAGGITAFPGRLWRAGGAFSVGVGWLDRRPLRADRGRSPWARSPRPIPTAGGLYHWASILGGSGWGWATAWINLLGLIFVVASVNFGVYLLFKDLVLAGVFGMDVSGWALPGAGDRASSLITRRRRPCSTTSASRLTTMLTDFSGYLIFVVAVVLTLTLPVLGRHAAISRG